ncbi:MAG: hypothetical protein WDZ63_06475 [Burkholderiales bacterium]
MPARRAPAPEPFVALFAFLLNFVWEMWQVPFYDGIGEGGHWNGVMVCTRATLGDVGIVLCAFWSVAVFSRSRRWLLAPTRAQIAAFLVVGVLITVIFEAIATGLLDRWQYGTTMPTLPLLGTGLLPLLQWLALPPLLLWLARNQVLGIERQAAGTTDRMI